MAKLLNVENGSEKKKNNIKGIILVLCVTALIIASLIHYYKANNNGATPKEEATYSLICVHVKGTVEKSGLYSVPWGTRVNDLGAVAGGFLENADLDGINLAEYVNDGEEIYIPYKGSAETGGYNLNTVSADEMIKNVDGIGETYANKIVSYRERVGRFTNVSELKAIVGDTVYEKVREKFYIE